MHVCRHKHACTEAIKIEYGAYRATGAVIGMEMDAHTRGTG